MLITSQLSEDLPQFDWAVSGMTMKEVAHVRTRPKQAITGGLQANGPGHGGRCMPVNPISEAAWHANGDVNENYVATFDWTQPWHRTG